MSTCPTFGDGGPSGIAEALRVVDCMSGEAASFAFSRLFGSDALLGQALTLALTLYIAFYAVGLLTGRTSLSVSSLTPRMMTLGIALTFATSWVAYQSVIWNLLVGAPDQIASLLIGSQGSATSLFADRLDTIFAVVAQAAALTEANASGLQQSTSLASGPDLLWLSALLLLLGTVGVLLVARIALAAMLALGRSSSSAACSKAVADCSRAGSRPRSCLRSRRCCRADRRRDHRCFRRCWTRSPPLADRYRFA